MRFSVEEYTVSCSFLSAIICEDYSSLDESESLEVNNFRDRNNLLDSKGHFSLDFEDTEPYFGRDCISGEHGLVMDIEWYRVVES